MMTDKTQPSPDPRKILTLTEVARYLKVAEKTLLRMVNRDEVAALRNSADFSRSGQFLGHI